jgi:hypothetical protein
MEKKNVNRCKDAEMNLEHNHQHVQQLHGYVVSLGLMEQCKKWAGNALKTLQFN